MSRSSSRPASSWSGGTTEPKVGEVSSTAIDNLPGALLDLLLAATPEPLPGLKELSTGRARDAADALAAHSASRLGAAWHYVAEHALPDGGALPYDDLHGRSVVASSWPSLCPHLDLLGADLALGPVEETTPRG